MKPILSLAFCLFIVQLIAQEVDDYSQSTEFELNNVTSNGSASESIPLVNINGDLLQVDLSMNYYLGGGIPVEELSTRLGLGWRLNGVDFVSRSVKGIPDEGYYRNEVLKLSRNGEEQEYGKIFNGYIQEPVKEFGNNISIDDQYLIANNLKDSQPDIFTYSAGQYSGQFYFTHNASGNLEVVNMNKNNVHIEPVFQYKQTNGESCIQILLDCDCEPPECCDANASDPCDIYHCQQFCCNSSCNVYALCEQANEDCLNGIGSDIASIQFKITTPDGIEYNFGGNDSNGTILEERSAAFGVGADLSDVPLNAGVTNTWMIRNIINLQNPQDIIQFDYGKESYSYISPGTEVMYMKDDLSIDDDVNIMADVHNNFHLPCDHYFDKNDAMDDARFVNGHFERDFQNLLYPKPSQHIINFINALRVESITSKYNQVTLQYSTANRKDLYTGAFEDFEGNTLQIQNLHNPSSATDPKVLIGIRSSALPDVGTASEISNISFDQDYYFNNTGNNMSIFPPPTNSNLAAQSLISVDCNRLMLKSISRESTSGRKLTQDFTYKLLGFGGSLTLPRRLSFTIDYWGFHNGDYDSGLFHAIPRLPYEVNNGRSFLNSCQRAIDRRSSWPEMSAGVLTEISNHLGSKKIIEYEPHMVNNFPDQHLYSGYKDGSLFPSMIGGLRIKEIDVKDANQNIMYSVSYRYYDSGVSTGKLLYIPTFIELFNIPGKQMRVHNANFIGNSDAICHNDRSIKVRGKIYSRNITPRVLGSSHIGYSKIRRIYEEGYTISNYNVQTDDELAGTSTPFYNDFGVDQYREPQSINEAMLRLSLTSEEVFEDDGGTIEMVAETINSYNVSTDYIDYNISDTEYAGMPFDKDDHFSQNFSASLGTGISNPIFVHYVNKDFNSNHSSCVCDVIDENNDGGQHNYLKSRTDRMYSGRVEIANIAKTLDGVTINTDYEYLNFDAVYNGKTNPIHVVKRIKRYPDADPSEKQVTVYSYAGESIYNDPTDPFYQATSPLILNRPTPSDPNTIELYQQRYIHTPITNQNWFQYFNPDGSQNSSAQVNASFVTMTLDNGILVPECNYEFIGDTWNLRSRAISWNTNGAPQQLYRAFIDTEYSDPINSSFYNPNYNYISIQDGLPSESFIHSPSEKLNHTRFTYYGSRQPKSEYAYKNVGGTEIKFNGTYITYDDFNRQDLIYKGVTLTDATGLPIDYKTLTTNAYQLKGLGDSENSQTSTISYNGLNSLTMIEEHQLLDDLGRQKQSTRRNANASVSNSYLLNSLSYNQRGKVATSYSIGQDTKQIIYEKSPLNRRKTLESQQAINNETVDILFGTNTGSEIQGFNPNTLNKSQVTDIDQRVVTKYIDYLERTIVDRRINDAGLATDTKHTYDNKGRLSQIVPPSGPVFVYTYNDRGLIATKTTPHSGTRTYYYDKLLRPVLEVDANGNKMVSVYDNYDRIVQTGLIQSSGFDIPNSVNDYYNVAALSLGINDLILTQSTYIPYTGFLNQEIATILDPANNASTTSLTTDYNSYDEVFGLPTSITKDNILGGEDIFTYDYNSSGEIYYSLHQHKKPGENDRYFQQKTYFDEMNRPWKTYLALEDNRPFDGQLITELIYDEYSRIETKKLHEVSAGDFLQEIDLSYDDFGRISKINDPATMFDNCQAQIYCNYELVSTNQNGQFSLGNLYYNNTSYFDLSNFQLSSTDNVEMMTQNLIGEIENQISQSNGVKPPIILDDISYSIQQLASGEWELTFTLSQTDYLFDQIVINERAEQLVRHDCCNDVGEIANNDLYWEELLYLNYIEDTNSTGQTLAKNSTNIHRKSYGFSCGNLKNYLYQYDALNRLKIAYYNEGVTPNFTEIPVLETDGSGLQGTYSTQFNYQNDLGDIGQIFRFGPGSTGVFNQGNASWGLQDAIDFTYNGNGRVSHTTEYGDKIIGHASINPNGVNTYTYDSNGNITSDSGKGINIINYAHFNLPYTVSNNATNESLDFVYDGAAQQLQKRHIDAGAIISIKSYMSGIEYTGNSMVDSRFDAYYHGDGLIKLMPDNSYEFQYYIKDHLGNNVIVFADRNKNDFVEQHEVIQQNDYYPFGAKMEEEGTEESTIDNQHKYNGKELHSEMNLNMYAYGARYYDPFIARFTGVDPIADQFPHVNVFNYAENSPISNIDLHGLQIFEINSPDLSIKLDNAFNTDYNPERIEHLINYSATNEFPDLYAAGLYGVDEQIPIMTMSNLEKGIEIWGREGVYASNATTGKTELVGLGDQFLIYSNVDKEIDIDPVQVLWNSAVVRNYIPDLLEIGIGGTAAYGPVGGTVSAELTWLLRGEPSIWPVATITFGSAHGKDQGGFIKAGGGYISGDPMRLRRNMIPTTGKDYTIGASGGGAIYGLSIAYTPSSQITMTSFQLTTPGGPSGSVSLTQSYPISIPDFSGLREMYIEYYKNR